MAIEIACIAICTTVILVGIVVACLRKQTKEQELAKWQELSAMNSVSEASRVNDTVQHETIPTHIYTQPQSPTYTYAPPIQDYPILQPFYQSNY